MKKLSKILAIVTLVAMLVTSLMAIPVSAGTINVGLAGTSNIPASVSWNVTAYKIFDVEAVTVGSDTIYNYSFAGTAAAKTALEGFFKDYFEDEFTPISTVPYSFDYLCELIVNLDDPTYTEPSKLINTDVDALAAALAAWVKSYNGNLATLEADKIASKPGVNTVTGLAPGYYLVAAVDNAQGSTLASRYIMTNVFDDSDVINVLIKNDVPAIDKQVLNTNTDPGVWGDWTDEDINDTVEFKLTSAVPEMKKFGYDYYKFIVTDTISKGLTLVDADDDNTNGIQLSDLVVTIGSATIPATAYQVTVTPIGANDDQYGDEYKGGHRIEIKFFTAAEAADFALATPAGNNWFFNETPGDAIVITYSAVLNEQAVIGPNGNPNKVDLTYSNNPNEGGNGDTDTTPGPEVRVYTFDMEIYKYSLVNGVKTKLPGVGFKLYSALDVGGADPTLIDETSVIKFNQVTDDKGTAADLTDDEWKYFVNKTGTVEELFSDAQGKIYLEGLDAGTYYLKETTPKAGYNPISGYYVVTITPEQISGTRAGKNVTGGHFEAEVEYNGVTVDTTDGTQNHGGTGNLLSIENRKGVVFPGTGGIGNTIFVLVGATMMGLGLISLVIFRKKIFGSK